MQWPLDPDECAFWLGVLAVLLVLMWAQIRVLDRAIARRECGDE